MNYNMNKIKAIPPSKVGVVKTVAILTVLATAILVEGCGDWTSKTHSIRGGGSIHTTGQRHAPHCSGPHCPSR